ncbi:MAG: hypothetical protein Q9168_007521 [Polycauliona sp. 1 TL-2023]
MNHDQSFQQPDFDYSQLRPAFPPQNTLFTDSQLAQSRNVNDWPDVIHDGQQTIPQATAATLPPPSGTEHTKHRRTRSGCYTCRQRRVKCDEARPHCARCQKGSRTCTYPEPRPKTKAGSSSRPDAAKTIALVAEASSSDEDGDDIEETPVSAGAKENVGDIARATISPRQHTRRQNAPSRTALSQSHKQPLPSIERTDPDPGFGHSPPTDKSSPQSPSHPDSRGPRHMELDTPESSLSPEKISLSHLPYEQRFYLDYLRNHITHHHYFFRLDAGYFLHHILIEQALSYAPLLHAVVGFAAFQATLGKPNGKIQDFLGYYNRSVSLLRKSLASGQKHTIATLLTILQLATIEVTPEPFLPMCDRDADLVQEYLGDWVNLLGHQKAAYNLLTELYSVGSITDSELSRKVLAWYARFDLFCGFMSGHGPLLGREWLVTNVKYYAEQAAQYPASTEHRLEASGANHRLIAIDMALLFAKFPRGVITLEQFRSDNELLAERIRESRKELEPLLSDERYTVEPFERTTTLDDADIVDSYKRLQKGPLWMVNLLTIDWLGTSIMHTYQTALMLQQPPPPELLDLALDVCRLFEAIQYWPGSVPGSMLSAQSGLGIAVVFLPITERYSMWARRKLAAIESKGYTYPLTLRNKLASLWSVPELRHWWLPDEEGYPPIVRSIRGFIKDRTQNTGHQHKDEDVRTMKGLFDKLNMNDGPEDGHERQRS